MKRQRVQSGLYVQETGTVDLQRVKGARAIRRAARDVQTLLGGEAPDICGPHPPIPLRALIDNLAQCDQAIEAGQARYPAKVAELTVNLSALRRFWPRLAQLSPLAAVVVYHALNVGSRYEQLRVNAVERNVRAGAGSRRGSKSGGEQTKKAAKVRHDAKAQPLIDRFVVLRTKFPKDLKKELLRTIEAETGVPYDTLRGRGYIDKRYK